MVGEDIRDADRSTSVDDQAVRYGIDRLLIRGRRIFGWGWISAASGGIESVALAISGDDWECEVPVCHGLAREDVRATFPSFRDAGVSGFVATGYVPGDIRRIVLEGRYADGSKRTFDVTAATDVVPLARRKLREVARIIGAIGRRARHGDWRGILARARAQDYRAALLKDDAVARTLRAHMGESDRLTIVFDHDMGGGANFYREQAIDERVTAGRIVLFCTYNLPTLDYEVALRGKSANGQRYRLSSFLPLDALIADGRVDEMLVNSPVSFDEPLVFAECVASIRERHPSVRLIVALHDYFAVCPSFMLINAEGNFCGVPALAECEACIKRHRASYVALTPPTSIAAWRATWGRLLSAADEVRCFSESTRSLLPRAYPALDQACITVIPHRVSLGATRLPTIDATAPLTIGVIGHINEQKGARLVTDIVRRLDCEERDARVVVIGTLDSRIVSPRLHVTGAYRRDELVGLIEAHRVNMVLFPSIGAETFSYVVAEAMHLQLPIVSFDLGAPAERLRHYADGRLCARVTADAALVTLVAFHGELAARAAAGREHHRDDIH